MVAKNISRKTVIATDCKECKTISDQSLGLLKKSNPRSLLFKTSFGIHTFGLKFAIDVMVLDGKSKVVKLGQVKPNSFFFWNPKYGIVLELPKGTIEKSQTKVGDLIGFS